MKKFVFKTVFLLLLGFLAAATVQAQGSLIRKIQNKAEDKIVDKIFKDSDESKQTDIKGVEGGSDTESSSPTRNRKGGGLSQPVPDVNQNITEAEVAYNNKSYSASKAAVRQALWGVELEIGRNLLKSMPEMVEGLKAVPEEDRVSSTGIGFVGLVIERVYRGKDDMELRTSIGNDAALLSLAGMYMVGGVYQSTDATNQKQIRFEDHNAIIAFDDYEGYTLSVPFGQSSIFVLKGANFDTESHFMAAANNFDINKIKKELGEQ